jgi:phosphoenolpyruvate-protein phosphotransferase (PTS system enzyme I)
MMRGTSVSSGIAHGTAYTLACAAHTVAPRRSIQAMEVPGELARLEAALSKAEEELLTLKTAVAEKIGPSQADIFGAQALLVRDPSLRAQVCQIIQEKLVNAESAVSEVIEKLTRTFDGIEDAYLRERAADVRDVGRRVLSALVEGQVHDGPDIPEGAIVVAEELLPSATARLEFNHARGFVTERGGRFSHASILARSLGIPAVAGVPEASLRIKSGDRLILDAFSGVVFVNPESSVEREYERLESEIRAYREELRHVVDLPSVTRDGTRIPLLANVSKYSDTETALLYNAEGIGLYRTEFGYSIRAAFPTEEEQYEFLKRAAERFHPRRVVLRLLDLGGDKDLPYFRLPTLRNPSLGQRGIRLLLKHPEVLKAQLRAFLRVSAEHPVSILLPVVSGLEEVRQTRGILRQVQDELSSQGQRFDPLIQVGAMVEVPAAALLARSLAKEVDFFSLGTNDLVQYVLAADREDETTPPSYQPLHPAVLRLIQSLAEDARDAGRALTICGEMGGDPSYTELLLGLGLREFSVAPGEMLAVKSAIRGVHLETARALAREALELGSAAEIEGLLQRRASSALRVADRAQSLAG